MGHELPIWQGRGVIQVVVLCRFPAQGFSILQSCELFLRGTRARAIQMSTE